MASLPVRDHLALRALVSEVCPQLARPRRDDAGTEIAGRSYHDLPMGAALCPELDKRSRPHLKAGNDSWRVDETYIKVKNVWMYLYRAVDFGIGNTLEFLLSPRRDAEAAKYFFVKALQSTECSVSP